MIARLLDWLLADVIERRIAAALARREASRAAAPEAMIAAPARDLGRVSPTFGVGRRSG
jgi:hypothetical protein